MEWKEVIYLIVAIVVVGVAGVAGGIVGYERALRDFKKAPRQDCWGPGK